MRHVSRTHRIDVDRLYDRINLDPMIQINYVSTTQKLADILTKRSFTGDRWTRVTLLVNIMTHTKFTQSNLLTFSAVNLVFSSMSKRARASFATSASAKQKPVHCSGPIARKTAKRMPSWTKTRSTATRLPSWRRLQAWKPVSAGFWKSHQDDARSIKLRATGSDWSIKLQATGCNRKSSSEKKVHLRLSSDGDFFQEVRWSCTEFQAEERGGARFLQSNR